MTTVVRTDRKTVVVPTNAGPQGPPGPAGSGSTIGVKGEGSTVSGVVERVNFTGLGVDITGSGADVNVVIPGTGGINFLTPQSEGAAANGTTNDSPAYTASNAALHALAIPGPPSTAIGYGAGAPPLYIPTAKYALSSTWDVKVTARYNGEGTGGAGGLATALYLAANITGVRAQFYNTTGDSATYTPTGDVFTSNGSVFDGIAVVGAYNGTTNLDGEYHGYFLRASVSVRDANIWNMQGDGIRIHADTGQPEYGNANMWEVRGAWVQNCRRAIAVDGQDANHGICYGLRVGNARQWGIYDNAGIANLYIGPFTQACGWSNNDGTAGKPVSTVTHGGQRYAVIKGQEVGASTNAPSGTTADNAYWYWYQAGGTDAYHPAWFSGIVLRAGGPMYLNGGTIIHGYAEGDQPPIQLGPTAFRIGGTYGNRVIGGAYIAAGDNKLLTNDIRITAGGVLIDDDVAGVVTIGRYSPGAGCALIKPSAACGYLAIVSPNNTQMIQVANAGLTVAGDIGLASGKVYKVDGTQVVGARQTGTPADATDLATALTLVNALKAKLVAHGLIS